MAQCPVCAAQIPDDFGLIECPSCSAQLIVHMDGRVEYSGTNAPVDGDEPLPETPLEPPQEFESDPFFEEEASPPLPEAAAPTPSDSGDLSDIARFGNSDATSLRDGSLRYNLTISGIDTADVREAFREAITDRKLVWDIDEILRSVKDGKVRIENVPPPKAYMVISRLRNLPVQIHWEQYAISQT